MDQPFVQRDVAEMDSDVETYREALFTNGGKPCSNPACQLCHPDVDEALEDELHKLFQPVLGGEG